MDGASPTRRPALSSSFIVGDNQSEFSHEDATTVVGEGENVLDLLLGTAEYDLMLIAECLKRHEGYELDLLG